jgi:hypothetical protein
MSHKQNENHVLNANLSAFLVFLDLEDYELQSGSDNYRLTDPVGLGGIEKKEMTFSELEEIFNKESHERGIGARLRVMETQ